MNYNVNFTVNINSKRALYVAAKDKALYEMRLTREELADWIRRCGVVRASLAIIFEPDRDGTSGFDIEDSFVA